MSWPEIGAKALGRTVVGFGAFSTGKRAILAECALCKRVSKVTLPCWRRGTKCICRNGHKHGMVYSSEYKSWQGMIQRCYNAGNASFPWYKDRVVCDRWRNSFELFFEDMGRKPTHKHQLDRIDNTGHYEPGNCRWATSLEQGRNKQNNVVVEALGQQRILAEWAQLASLSRAIIGDRLRRGWHPDKAVTVPVNRGKHASREIRVLFRLPGAWQEM